jgi:hypothetical protein
MNVDDDRNIADVTLERYRLNELPAETTARLNRRVHDDEELRRRLEALQRSDTEIRGSDRLELVAARVQRSLAGQGATAERKTWISVPRWGVPAAAAIVLAVLFIPRMTTLSPTDDERIKGLDPSLTLFRRVANGSETLADGAMARPGDLIRVGYRAAGRAYGVILSIDGRGNVTVHLPRHGDTAAPLGREPTVLLDYSYELDDAPRWELFYFVTGNEPFMVAPIVASATRVAMDERGTPAALTLADGLEQSTFSLLKEGQP